MMITPLYPHACTSFESSNKRRMLYLKDFFLSPSLSLLKTKKEGFNGDNILFPNALFLCLLRSRPLKLNVPF